MLSTNGDLSVSYSYDSGLDSDAIIQLATSDSPNRTQKSIDSIAGQLQNSGIKLINFNKIGKLPSITEIVLDARIRGAIKKELFTEYNHLKMVKLMY